MEKVNAGRRIALIGGMGSGKSRLARRLAQKYGATVTDTDAVFTARFGDISEFFARFGEAEFRRREGEIIKEIARSDCDIVATGGGAVLSRAGMNELRRTREIVYLTAPRSVLKARIERSARPLKASFDEIMDGREPLYEKYADYTVSSETDALVEFEKALSLPRRRRYDVVLCDADDTLIDFKRAMRHSITSAAHAFGVEKSDGEVVAAYCEVNDLLWGKLERGEISRNELFSRRFELLAEKLGADFDAAEMRDVYTENMRGTRFTLDGAREFLTALRKKGVRVYIITNSFTYIAKERLKAVADCADGAFISEEVGFDKPDPRFFRAVLEATGAERSRTLVFGDGENSDIAGALASGLDCCRFDETRGKPTAADFSVADYKELLELV